MRLIDADVLIDKMDRMVSDAILADTEIPYALIRELIAEAPTIEPKCGARMDGGADNG